MSFTPAQRSSEWQRVERQGQAWVTSKSCMWQGPGLGELTGFADSNCWQQLLTEGHKVTLGGRRPDKSDPFQCSEEVSNGDKSTFLTRPHLGLSLLGLVAAGAVTRPSGTGYLLTITMATTGHWLVTMEARVERPIRTTWPQQQERNRTLACQTHTNIRRINRD